MKVFKTLVAILVVLLIVFSGVYYFMYRIEVTRVKESRDVYKNCEDVSEVKLQGKIIEIDGEERTLLIQIYEYRKPVEGMKFYALNNSGSYKIEREVGDWVEIRGRVSDYIDGIPVVQTEYFNEWLYLYFDIGVFPPK